MPTLRCVGVSSWGMSFLVVRDSGLDMTIFRPAILFLVILSLQAAFATLAGANADESVAVGQADEAYQPEWEAILALAGIKPDYKQFASNRQRRQFLDADIVLDCCVSPDWGFTDEERETQLLSKPFLRSAAYLVLPQRLKDNATKTEPQNLKDMTIALVEGFQYPGSDDFGTIVTAPDVPLSVRLVVSGQADATILTRHQLYQLKWLRPNLPIKLGPLHHSYSLVARVHKSRPDLLEKLNAAIDRSKRAQIDQALVPVRAYDMRDSAYKAVWHRILQVAEITPQWVLSDGNLRRDQFVNGDILLDCCAPPEWREKPEEQAVQLFSSPVTTLTEYLVVRDDRDITSIDTANLSSYRIAGIRGFTYARRKDLGEVVDYTYFGDAMRAVASGEADMTIMGSTEFARRQRAEKLPLKLGPEFSRVLLRVRVHKDRAELLDQINAAIAHLKETGEINRLIGQLARR